MERFRTLIRRLFPQTSGAESLREGKNSGTAAAHGGAANRMCIQRTIIRIYKTILGESSSENSIILD